MGKICQSNLTIPIPLDVISYNKSRINFWWDLTQPWWGDCDLKLDRVVLPLKDQVGSLGSPPPGSGFATWYNRWWSWPAGAFHQLSAGVPAVLCPFLEQRDLVTVTHAFVTSRLNYGNVLCLGLPLEMIWKFQLVQNAVAQMLVRASKFQHVTPILWLPVVFLLRSKVLVLTHKALSGLRTGYLNECLLKHHPSHTLCSMDAALLWVPSAGESQRVTPGHRAFSAMASPPWNSLPQDACQALSLAIFLRMVKMELFVWEFTC